MNLYAMVFDPQYFELIMSQPDAFGLLQANFNLLLSAGGKLVARNAGATAERWVINVTDEALGYISRKHVAGGLESAGKSAFNVGEDLVALAKAGTFVQPRDSFLSRSVRVVDAGRIIGIVRGTNKPTSVYTIVTTKENNLFNMFPGTPGD